MWQELLAQLLRMSPAKDEAWQDLVHLIQDQDSYVQWYSAEALGSAFVHVPAKDEAWQDLHRLTQDKDNDVRRYSAEVLGSAFVHVPAKDEAWQDLHRLTQDKDNDVRMYAYHSLGRASVAKATAAENRDCLLNEIKAAIIYLRNPLMKEV